MSEKPQTTGSKALLIYLLLLIFAILLIVPEEVVKERTIVGKVIASVRIVSGNAPFFDHNISNFTVNQTETFFFDVNCSDIDVADEIRYYENFTGFEINTTTGIINQSYFNQSFVGNNTIEIWCSDGIANASAVFILEVIDVNDPPVLSPIGSQIATEGELFTLDVDAVDADNDTLIFNASTTLFAIDNETGLINFTPSLSQVGNYTINISVFDGEFYDYEVISFRIVRGPYCGDGSCSSTESCSSCSEDCGSCSSAGGGGAGGAGGAGGSSAGGEGGGGGTGGGGVSGGGFGMAPYYRCDERWECSEWSTCSVDGEKTRKCKDINRCGTKKKKPSEIEVCEYEATCNDGIQNGGETGIDCGGPCEPCVVPNCFDGIKNCHDGLCEDDIDCGGPCKSCEIKKFAKIPHIESLGIFKIPRKFPWLLIAVVGVLLALTVAADVVNVRRITKKDFEEYRESMRKYKAVRRKLYHFVINTATITLISSIYIYIFSNDAEKLVKFAWIPITMVLVAPFAVSAVMRHYTYYEYKKRKKEGMLNQTHKRELLRLIKLENELLYDMESDVKHKIHSMALAHTFDRQPALYKEISPIYSYLVALGRERKERIGLSASPTQISDKILAVVNSRILAKAAREYPEFMSIYKALKDIKSSKNYDAVDKEEEFLEGIKDISKPHMKTVIMSDKRLITLYNYLVDIYNHYSEKHEKLKKKDSRIMSIERSFNDKVKEITKKAALMETIGKEKEIALLYNSMVDLFNHYMKKQELSKAVRDL
jgi:uncharacterized membrane protein YgcG